MSYSFYVGLDRQPRASELVREGRALDPMVTPVARPAPRADIGGSAYYSSPEADTPLDEATELRALRYLNLYSPSKSAAGLELSWDDDEGLQLRCMGLASRADYGLAIALAGRIAKSRGLEVVTEDGEELAPEAVAQQFGREWQDRQLESCAVLAIRQKANFVQTPRWPLFLGKQLSKALEATAAPARSLVERLQQLVSWTDGRESADYFPASPMKTNGIGTLSAWRPDVRYLFTPVDFLAVQDPAEPAQLVLVPWKSLAKVAGLRATAFDEQQYLVEPIPDSEHDLFFKTARGVGQIV